MKEILSRSLKKPKNLLRIESTEFVKKNQIIIAFSGPKYCYHEKEKFLGWREKFTSGW
jgi:hypothetical protein